MLAFPLALLAVTFTSCFDDEDEQSVEYYLDVATVTTGGQTPAFATDEGFAYHCLTTENADSFAVGERYFLVYTCSDTTTRASSYFDIQLAEYQKVHIRSFSTLPKDSTDNLDSQPLRNIGWIWTSGSYLNTVFQNYKPLTTPSSFDLVRIKKSESNLSTDTVPTIYFKLLHHVDYLNTGYYTRQALSYDMSPLATEYPSAYKIKLNVSWVTSDGSDSYEFVYVPESIDTPQNSLKRSTGFMVPSEKLSAGGSFSGLW